MCAFSHDGICNDGEPGSVDAKCRLGEDCADCGSRDYASCSLGGGWTTPCYDFQLANRVCDPGCNTFQCAYDSMGDGTSSLHDCTTDQSVQACLEATTDALRAPPREPQVQMRIAFSPLGIQVGLQPSRPFNAVCP